MIAELSGIMRVFYERYKSSKSTYVSLAVKSQIEEMENRE